MNEIPEPPIADRWDAGSMGCGELVILLRRRMLALQPGEVFELIATDEGAVIDIPAWCGLTGHTLILQDPPRFLIRRKDS